MRKLYSVIFSFLSLIRLYAYDPVPGSIPLQFGHYPATDLVCDRIDCAEGVSVGDILTPQEAIDYYFKRSKQTAGQWNLSELNPKESALWKDRIGDPGSVKDNILGLKDMSSTRFLSKAAARLGMTRLTIQDSDEKMYTIMFGKRIHNILLRRSLLRRLGYTIPATKYIKRIKLEFKSVSEITDLIKEIKIVNTATWKRWILSIQASPGNLKEKVDLIRGLDFEIPKGLDINKTYSEFSSEDQKILEKILTENLIGGNKNEIILQDLVAMEDQEYTLNLSRGYIEQYLIQGQRSLDSLIIPYALTSIPESINMFSWIIGRERSGNIFFDMESNEKDLVFNFDCSRGDAYWMVKRILKLTLNDWEEIVNESKLPRSVQVLLLEKLKSRRNNLAKLFKIDTKSFTVNSTVSSGDDLIEGEIIKEFYDGFARRFSIPDPDSPFLFSDMLAMFKSKTITTGIEFLINSFNSAGILGTDVGDKITKKAQEYEKSIEDIIAQNTAQAILSGNDVRTPIKAYAFPTIGGNIILNREINSGSFMGTDNFIQLVDSIGFSSHIGMFGGLFGVNARIGKNVPVRTDDGTVASFRQLTPINLSADGRVYYSRVYSHIRKINSIQEGLKYKYHNMIVPLVKRRYSHYFDKLMNADYQKMSDKQKRTLNKNFLNSLKAIVAKFELSYKKARKYQDKEVLEALSELKKIIQDRSDEIVKAKNQQTSGIVSELLKSAQNFKEVVDKFYGDHLKKSRKKKRKTKDLLAASSNLVVILNDQYHRLSGVQRTKDFDEMMKVLGENMSVGDSLLVTDTVGGSLVLGAGTNLYNIAQVNLNVRPDKMVVRRLNILKIREDEVHVYKTHGNVKGLQFSARVDQVIPILKLSLRSRKGSAKTEFFKIPIGNTMLKNGRRIPNENRLEKVRALRDAFRTSRVKRIKSIINPIVLKHRFTDNSQKIGLAVARFNFLNQADRIQITSKEGHAKEIHRHYLGRTSGLDFENYVRDLTELIIARAFNTNQTISSFNEGNPGFTFMGRAKNQVLSYETIIDPQSNTLTSQVVQVSNVWNGWQLKKKRALKILEKIKKRYKFAFFDKEVFAQTKKMILYNISANVFIYEDGLKHLLSLSEEKIKAVWKKHQTRNMTNFAGNDALKHSGVLRALKYRRRYSKFLIENNRQKMGKSLLKFIRLIDQKLSLKGVALLVGGEENLYAVGKIGGFRIGDVDGDKQITSSSFGRYGKEGVSGPMTYIRKFLGMVGQEFSLNWLLGRVI